MTRGGIWLSLLTAGLLSSSGLIGAQGQPSASDPPRFRVGVDVVRLDAVVTDRNGALVTNLTADDFDVHQDGRPQKITLAQWVPIAGPQGGTIAQPPGASPGAGVPPHLSRGTVQRTIMIVVDDLGTSFESMPPARAALHRMVDEDLQPTDLAAVVRTSQAANVIQQFTNDPRVLHNAIDALTWNWRSRTAVAGLPPFGSLPDITINGRVIGAPGFGNLEALRASMSGNNSLGALALLIRRTRDLPGRKAMVLVSEGMTMLDRFDGPGGEIRRGVLPDIRVVMPRDHVVDQAVRSGVVVYALDPRTLQSAGLRPEDDLTFYDRAQLRAAGADRHQFLIDTQDFLTHISEQTGGFAVLNTNDLARGLRKITDDQRGYYLIGYTPDSSTFAKPGKTIRYHRISVEVKQPGLRVRTHAGFIGLPDEDKRTAPKPGTDLYAAALSPFTADDVPMRITTDIAIDGGTAIVAKAHIGGHALSFVADRFGQPLARADVLAILVDADGQITSSSSGSFTINQLTLPLDTTHLGFLYEANLKVSKPGRYQVRLALQDRNSHALGSDGEFVDVPEPPRVAAR